MARSRLGLKALVLSGLVLGLMAFSASGAQAETGANWMVGANNITTTLLPTAHVKELEGNTATLKFTTGGGTLVEILCTSAELVEGGVLLLNGGISLGRALFHGCITKLNGATSIPCEPFSGTHKGLIESKKATGLIILHLTGVGTNVVPLVKLTPDTLNEFATITLGEECSIGESVPVAGSLTAKDSEFTTSKTEHLISEGPLTSLTALSQPATLVGSAIINLAGTDAGAAWSGLPATTKP